MGSKTFDGVRFSIYPADHHPPHVHATTSGVIAVIDLMKNGDVALEKRPNAVTPGNAKRNVISKMLRVASENVDELVSIWERTHGAR